MEKQIAKTEQEVQLAKNTLIKSLELYSPNKCARSFKSVNTIKKSIELKLPSLVSYKKKIGEEKLESIIQLWLIDLNDCLNLRRPMSEGNIDFIAMNIISDFGNLTFSDINLVFTRAKKGYYGELYESLNTAKVLGWFSQYFEDRLETAAEISLLNHSNIKKLGTEKRISEGTRSNGLSIQDMKGIVTNKNTEQTKLF